jgi:thioester reductase-like protein
MLLLDLIKFGSAPESDFILSMTPVNEMSKTIVELGESEKTLKETINLSHTHTITFKAIWTEICRQQNKQPHFINVTEWRRKLDEQLKTDSQLLRGLQLFSDALTDPFSEDTVTTISAESDLNLSIFEINRYTETKNNFILFYIDSLTIKFTTTNHFLFYEKYFDDE